MKKVEVKIEIKSSPQKAIDGYRDGDAWDWYYEAVKQVWPVVLHELKIFLEK